MTRILQARVGDTHIAKLNALKSQTGLTTSQLFRQFIDLAEVKPAEIAVKLSKNANSDVSTYQGQHVATA